MIINKRTIKTKDNEEQKIFNKPRVTKDINKKTKNTKG